MKLMLLGDDGITLKASPLPSATVLAMATPWLQRFWAWRPRTLSARLARVGFWVLLVYVLIALFSPLLFQLGLLADVNSGLENPINAAPSLDHWCGTNRLGQDVCARTIAGAGVALQVVVLALSLALVVGVPLGMLSGYFGGPVDRVLVLLMDTVYSLPVVLLAVVMAFLLGQGLLNAAAALCVVYVPQYFRVVRNQTASVKAELFVEAAQSLGLALCGSCANTCSAMSSPPCRWC